MFWGEQKIHFVINTHKLLIWIHDSLNMLLRSIYNFKCAFGFSQLSYIIHHWDKNEVVHRCSVIIEQDKMSTFYTNGMSNVSPLITRVSNFRWTSFRMFTEIAILTIATILYLSLSSRTGNLKCGRFIKIIRTILGDENQKRDVRDSRASLTTRNRSIEWKRRRQAPWSLRLIHDISWPDSRPMLSF